MATASCPFCGKTIQQYTADGVTVWVRHWVEETGHKWECPLSWTRVES